MISMFLCKLDQQHGFGNRGGPLGLPPRSPDLTPMDFFLLGEMKCLVYEIPLDTEEKLVAHVAAAAEVIFQSPGIFEPTDSDWYVDATFVLKSTANNFSNMFK